MVLLDDNVNVVNNIHHTWYTTPILEIHHDLHFSLASLIMSFLNTTLIAITQVLQ
jgi:hypothetical protein